MFKLLSLFIAASLSLFIASCSTGSTDEKVVQTTPKATTYVTMPGNTAIDVILADSIDTDVQVTGEQFYANLSRAIVVDGQTLFADGAAAKGVLNKVVESGRLKTPAELNFSLTAIKNRNGNWVNVSTNEIQDAKASHTAREVAMIGGGAIVGGIIGKIIDRKGSTEIGAAAGAAAGTGLVLATGKRDIFYGAGTQVTFFSRESMKVALN